MFCSLIGWSLLALFIPSLCTFSSSFLVDLDLLIFNISILTLPKESLSVEEFVTDSDARPSPLLKNQGHTEGVPEAHRPPVYIRGTKVPFHNLGATNHILE